MSSNGFVYKKRNYFDKLNNRINNRLNSNLNIMIWFVQLLISYLIALS